MWPAPTQLGSIESEGNCTPCDSIQLNTIDLGKMNATLLTRALRTLGAVGNNQYFQLEGVSCQIRGGKLIVPEGAEHLADKLKRAYSVETVKYTAQRNGWQLVKKSEFVYEVNK